MQKLIANQRYRSAHRVAFTVTLAFVLAGISWVLGTDILLYHFTRDPVLIARIETAKGWTFVTLAAALLYTVTLRSATRMARVQAAISAVVDSIADGVLLLGPDRTIMRANPAAVRMLRCDDLVGMGAPEFSRRFRVSYPEGSLVPPDQFVSQRVFDEAGPLRYKAILHPPDSPELVISVTAAVVRERPDAPAQFVVSVMHDITSAEHLERLRDEFFAAAAHALKTPIAIIKANVQAVGCADAVRATGSIAAIERQCNRIDRLVRNLLVLARARTKSLRLRQDEVALDALVARIAAEMTSASPDHDVCSEVSAAPRVCGDDERLGLALSNLIDQSFRLSKPGSTVTVLLAEAGTEARIGVRYQPLPPDERTDDFYAEYAEIGVSRMVVETIVEAHSATLSEDTADTETVLWIHMHTLETAGEHD